MSRSAEESDEPARTSKRAAKGAAEVEDVGAPTASPAPIVPPKPRGRPKGSTNKRQVKVTLAPDVRDQLAVAPLWIAGQIVAQLTRDEAGNPVVELSYPPESLVMVKEAFAAWLDSAGLELSPGWALLGAYALAVASAVPKAVQDVRAEQASAEKAKADPAKPVNTVPIPVATAPSVSPAEPTKEG